MELTLTTIISFVGAVLSALLAGIFAFIGSRYAAKAQINTTAQNAFISARLNAFRLYEEAFEIWSKEKSIASCAAVYRAENTVRLVASDETIRTLGTLTAYVRLYETTKAAQSLDDITSAHAAALLSMRNDLLHYPIPSPDSTHKK
jgi:hypothetical protein